MDILRQANLQEIIKRQRLAEKQCHEQAYIYSRKAQNSGCMEHAEHYQQLSEENQAFAEDWNEKRKKTTEMLRKDVQVVYSVR